MCKAIKSTCKNPVEGVHEYFHCVLHGIMEPLSNGIASGLGLLEGDLLLVALGHQIFEQRRNHPLSQFGFAEQHVIG